MREGLARGCLEAGKWVIDRNALQRALPICALARTSISSVRYGTEPRFVSLMVTLCAAAPGLRACAMLVNRSSVVITLSVRLSTRKSSNTAAW
jgi:hypothetical protein